MAEGRMVKLLAIIFVFLLPVCYVEAKTPIEQTKKSVPPLNASQKSESKTLSLNFRDIPVRDLLALLAQFAQMNLVLNDAVKGNVTIRLDDVTWRQALDTILDMENLGMRQEGKILLIAPTLDIAARESEQLSSTALKTELIRVRYARAADLSGLLQHKNAELLSQRGSVIVDERTNQLWVKDTPDRLIQIREFLKNVDIPVKQVQISARILNVDEQSVKELGIKFGTVASNEGSSASTDGLHMDMPLTNDDVGHFTMAIANLGEGTLLDLEISALEREGRAHIISKPQLVTANRQAAVIESGQEIPYQEKTSSGATNTTFKKAVLSLKVTPEITLENKVLLNLMVNQDKVDTLTVDGMPAISTQQIQSQVLIGDGETIVVGGIYEEKGSDVAERIPFLSAIPGLGKLFTNKEKQSGRRELLIFVTPKILIH